MPRAYPSDLSEIEWQLIEPLLPAQSAIGHPRAVELRDTVEAIFYVQREGYTWRALPDDFPAWQTGYGYLRLRQKRGIWQRVHDTLRTQLRAAVGKKPQASAGIIDSQSLKTTEKRGGWCLEATSSQGSHPAGGVHGFDVAKQTKGRPLVCASRYVGIGHVVGGARGKLSRALRRCHRFARSGRGS